MQYFVIGPDGSKYGPADMPTLQQWVAEGRIQPMTQLEDSAGTRLLASQLPGLLPMQPTVAHPRPMDAGQGPISADDGARDISSAYIYSALGIFCCPIVLCLVGFNYATKAERKGNPNAGTAKTVSIVCLVLGIALNFGVRFLTR